MQFKPVSSALIPSLVNFIYPSSCPICNQKTDSLAHAPFCRKCWQNITQYTGPSCRICGVPLVSIHANICQNCIASPPVYEKAVSFGLYEGVLASAIHHLKFIGIRRLSKPLSDLMLFHDTSGIDAVIPVPLSHAGLTDRGFNQALLLAHMISKNKKVPLMMDSLHKIIDTRPQVGLSAKERASNVRNAFICSKPLNGMRVLLIDDVMTTGATVNSCAAELKKAGAESVSVLTLARAGKI